MPKDKDNLESWFLSLSLKERISALALEDRGEVRLIHNMYVRKRNKGISDGKGIFYGCFLEVGQGESLPQNMPSSKFRREIIKRNFNDSKANDFLFRKADYAPTEEEILFERSIRFSDSKEYCDTITLSSELISDGRKFLRVMAGITDNSFLNDPCLANWDEKTKSWEWKTRWFFSKGWYSLSFYVAYRLAITLWRNYWIHSGKDPRARGVEKKYPLQLQQKQRDLEVLHSKEAVTNFWDNVGVTERDTIIHGLVSMVKKARKNPDKKEATSSEQCEALSRLLQRISDEDPGQFKKGSLKRKPKKDMSSSHELSSREGSSSGSLSRVPDDLVCTETKKIFLDPVRLSDGKVYEREVIMEKLKNGSGGMRTETIKTIETDTRLQQRIARLLDENPELRKNQYQRSTSSLDASFQLYDSNSSEILDARKAGAFSVSTGFTSMMPRPMDPAERLDLEMQVMFRECNSITKENFIEYLFFTSMQRYGTAFDRILREMGVRIQAACANKIGNDLILAEEIERNTKRDKMKQKRAKYNEKRKRQMQAKISNADGGTAAMVATTTATSAAPTSTAPESILVAVNTEKGAKKARDEVHVDVKRSRSSDSCRKPPAGLSFSIKSRMVDASRAVDGTSTDGMKTVVGKKKKRKKRKKRVENRHVLSDSEKEVTSRIKRKGERAKKREMLSQTAPIWTSTPDLRSATHKTHPESPLMRREVRAKQLEKVKTPTCSPVRRVPFSASPVKVSNGPTKSMRTRSLGPSPMKNRKSSVQTQVLLKECWKQLGSNLEKNQPEVKTKNEVKKKLAFERVSPDQDIGTKTINGTVVVTPSNQLKPRRVLENVKTQEIYNSEGQKKQADAKKAPLPKKDCKRRSSDAQHPHAFIRGHTRTMSSQQILVKDEKDPPAARNRAVSDVEHDNLHMASSGLLFGPDGYSKQPVNPLRLGPELTASEVAAWTIPDFAPRTFATINQQFIGKMMAHNGLVMVPENKTVWRAGIGHNEPSRYLDVQLTKVKYRLPKELQSKLLMDSKAKRRNQLAGTQLTRTRSDSGSDSSDLGPRPVLRRIATPPVRGMINFAISDPHFFGQLDDGRGRGRNQNPRNSARCRSMEVRNRRPQILDCSTSVADKSPTLQGATGATGATGPPVSLSNQQTQAPSQLPVSAQQVNSPDGKAIAVPHIPVILPCWLAILCRPPPKRRSAGKDMHVERAHVELRRYIGGYVAPLNLHETEKSSDGTSQALLKHFVGQILHCSMDLHEEIKHFQFYVTFVVTEARAIYEEIIRRVTGVVTGIWAKAKVDQYGSYATGLLLPSSDIDLVVSGVCSVEDVKARIDTFRSRFHKLADELRKNSWVHNVKAIHTAKVPVIKLTCTVKNRQIPVDITFDFSNKYKTPISRAVAEGKPSSVAKAVKKARSLDSLDPLSDIEAESAHSHHRDEPNIVRTRKFAPRSPTPQSVHNGVKSVSLIKGYLQQLPALKPLVLVLKQFLYERGFINIFRGGLSSYCLILMIVSFLRHRDPEGKGRSTNWGFLLMRFLFLYGQVFNYAKTGIDPEAKSTDGIFFDKAESHCLTILDPLDPETDIRKRRNIGAGVWNMFKIQSAFTMAESFLLQRWRTFHSTQLYRIIQQLGNPHRVENTIAFALPPQQSPPVAVPVSLSPMADVRHIQINPENPDTPESHTSKNITADNTPPEMELFVSTYASQSAPSSPRRRKKGPQKCETSAINPAPQPITPPTFPYAFIPSYTAAGGITHGAVPRVPVKAYYIQGSKPLPAHPHMHVTHNGHSHGPNHHLGQMYYHGGGRRSQRSHEYPIMNGVMNSHRRHKRNGENWHPKLGAAGAGGIVGGGIRGVAEGQYVEGFPKNTALVRRHSYQGEGQRGGKHYRGQNHSLASSQYRGDMRMPPRQRSSSHSRDYVFHSPSHHCRIYGGKAAEWDIHKSVLASKGNQRKKDLRQHTDTSRQGHSVITPRHSRKGDKQLPHRPAGRARPATTSSSKSRWSDIVGKKEPSAEKKKSAGSSQDAHGPESSKTQKRRDSASIWQSFNKSRLNGANA